MAKYFMTIPGNQSLIMHTTDRKQVKQSGFIHLAATLVLK